MKKNKKDCEKKINELEIYFNQTIINLQEEIYIIINNTNNTNNLKKFEKLELNDSIKVDNYLYKDKEKNEKEIENQNKIINENNRNEDYNNYLKVEKQEKESNRRLEILLETIKKRKEQ